MKSRIELKTSYVSPLNLNTLISSEYLPIFAIRHISNSPLVGQYSGSAIHLPELSPSTDLFRLRKTNLISKLEFDKRFVIEMSNVNLNNIITKFEKLINISGARGIVIMGYSSQLSNCYRGLLSDLFNESGLLEKTAVEIII